MHRSHSCVLDIPVSVLLTRSAVLNCRHLPLYELVPVPVTDFRRYTEGAAYHPDTLKVLGGSALSPAHYKFGGSSSPNRSF